MGYKVQVIAEVGVNHNGQIDLAFKLIDVALNAGADVVKFHASIPKLNISTVAVKADYQLSTTDPNETQLEMCEKMTLSFEELRKLKTYAEKNQFYYLDYFSALDDGNKGIISNYTYDGVHLNLKGYQLIEPMVEEAIQNVLE